MRPLSFARDVLPLKEKLFRLALRITSNRAEAEDIVQETLIRIWNKRNEWEKLDSIEAYSFTITRNLALDLKERKDAQTIELTPALEPADATTPYDRLVRKEQLRLIHRLIGSLPEKQRQTMLLRDVDGLSYREIAQALHLPEEQVKVNLFRARQKVRQQLLHIESYRKNS
ncbi:MAG: sigma-70 family RNA polymerase sigma factor [Prevotellaceae bacterium]|jgi:RNA polymerase sigma-70 factor (ECF subfamily)|nr:sigma-70 family RNA polymerase sigma factor [Prevotellaceae bacterium]